MRALICALGAGLLLGATGCQTPHVFATPDPSWKSSLGQLKHTTRERTVIGEVVVLRRGADEFQLDFLKGGSFPLISVRQDASVSRADGVIARGRWQGSPGAAPSALRPWLVLREAFAQPAASPSGAVTSWRGAARKGGALLDLQFPGEGQRFEFQLAR